MSSTTTQPSLDRVIHPGANAVWVTEEKDTTMRRSHLLLAGLGVTAVAVTGSAFTAGNTEIGRAHV